MNSSQSCDLYVYSTYVMNVFVYSPEVPSQGAGDLNYYKGVVRNYSKVYRANANIFTIFKKK